MIIGSIPDKLVLSLQYNIKHLQPLNSALLVR